MSEKIPPQTQIVRKRGKRWRLPIVLPFTVGAIVKSNWRFYEVVDYRPPKAGEYYVSGGPPEAYKAFNDLSTPYLVVRPTDKAKRIQVWVRA